MRLLLTTPLYPPQVGGPAKYAVGLEQAFRALGHTVQVVAYGKVERRLPPGLRHGVYFMRLLPLVWRVDVVVALDAASVGVPAYFVARLARKKVLIRLGGDFVWEQYVERTRKDITLREFNKSLPQDLTQKEKLIYALCRYVLRRTHIVAFNTEWFREVIVTAYGIQQARTAVVANEMPLPHAGEAPNRKTFLFAGRQIFLKNETRLHEAFARAKEKRPEIVLDEGVFSPTVLKEKLRTCYAVLQPSLSDVAPNLVLEGLAYGKPFILTRETGLAEPLKGYGLFVDPRSVADIEEKILMLADSDTYAHYANKAGGFEQKHSFEDIAREYIALL